MPAALARRISSATTAGNLPRTAAAVESQRLAMTGAPEARDTMLTTCPILRPRTGHSPSRWFRRNRRTGTLKTFMSIARQGIGYADVHRAAEQVVAAAGAAVAPDALPEVQVVALFRHAVQGAQHRGHCVEVEHAHRGEVLPNALATATPSIALRSMASACGPRSCPCRML